MTAISALVACTAPAPAPDGLGGTATSSVEAPEFAGPFAAEYRDAWEKSGTEFVHGVLVDEQISDQEWAEVAQRMTDCFESNAATFGGYESDGAYSAAPKDRSLPSEEFLETMDDCEVESGHRWIGMLRGLQRMNPENRDIFTIMAECLVREGAVASGYTAEDYKRDFEADTFPFLEAEAGHAIYLACNDDPLALGLK